MIGQLVGWILWHINLCRLFNAKSILKKIVLFQTIQYNIRTQFKCNYILIVKNISISSYSVQSSSSNSVQYKYRFCLHTVKCKNSSILNNSVQCKYSFNAKKTVLFQIIQFSVSMQFKCKYGLIVKNISISNYSVYSRLGHTVQFSISMPFVLFNPLIGSYQVLPHRARMDLGAVAMKGFSAFPKAPALLEPHHQIVQCHVQDTH